MDIKPIALFLFLFFSGPSCVKDSAIVTKLAPEILKTPTIKFVFVNRFGWRKDSVNWGGGYKVFQGPCIDSKFYDKKSNISYLNNICYNRNFPSDNFPTIDSINFKEFDLNNGCKYAMQIEMRWWNYSYAQPQTKTLARLLTFNTKSWPNGDSVFALKDTIIKFVWPDDSSSAKFIRAYQWP